MRILLDTHCWLWMQLSPERFSPESLSVVSDPYHEIYLSAASAWEIAIKYRLGKLPLPVPPHEYIPSRMESSNVLGLAVQHAHAAYVAELPDHHRDPFDRLLVAQTVVEKLPILTADAQFRAYEVEVLDA